VPVKPALVQSLCVILLVFLPTKSGTVFIQIVGVGVFVGVFVGVGVFVAVGVLVGVGGTVVFVGVGVLVGTAVFVGVGAPASETVTDDVAQGTLMPAARLWLATSQLLGPPFSKKLLLEKPAPVQADLAALTLLPIIGGTIHIGMVVGVLVAVATAVFVGVFVGIGVASASQPVVMLREATAWTLTFGINACVSGSSSWNE
jgi:hypothetical protein